MCFAKDAFFQNDSFAENDWSKRSQPIKNMFKNRVLFAHPLVKSKMSKFHQSDLYIPDKYQKKSGRPLINWTRMKSFTESKYPGIEQFPIIQQKKKRPEWKPLSPQAVESRLKYMNGVNEEELMEADVPEYMKGAFSWNTASHSELNNKEIQQIILRFGKNAGDSGSTPVQIAVLTHKIRYLENYAKRRKHDNQNKRFLAILKKRRKGLLKYLLRRNASDYYETLKSLKITMALEGPVFIK
jgi:small subunit ribosomal protein S15